MLNVSIDSHRKTRKTRCSTRSTKVPEGSENPRERGSDLEVGLGPPGGGRLASSGSPKGLRVVRGDSVVEGEKGGGKGRGSRGGGLGRQ